MTVVLGSRAQRILSARIRTSPSRDPTATVPGKSFHRTSHRWSMPSSGEFVRAVEGNTRENRGSRRIFRSHKSGQCQEGVAKTITSPPRLANSHSAGVLRFSDSVRRVACRMTTTCVSRSRSSSRLDVRSPHLRKNARAPSLPLGTTNVSCRAVSETAGGRMARTNRWLSTGRPLTPVSRALSQQQPSSAGSCHVTGTCRTQSAFRTKLRLHLFTGRSKHLASGMYSGHSRVRSRSTWMLASCQESLIRYRSVVTS